MSSKGILFVVSAPSGTGKTSLCREVSRLLPHLSYSISYTTRSPREGEVEGLDYYFVSDEVFHQMIERNEFLEWAEVHGHLYGTSSEHLTRVTNEGKDVILDIDVQGAMQLKKKEVDGVYIFLLPPSLEDLKARLTRRRSDSPEDIARRMKKAKEEIWHYREYYYLIVNDDLKKALTELSSVIVAERVKMKRMNLSWIEENFIKENPPRPPL